MPELLARMFGRRHRRTVRDELPFGEELYSVEYLEEYARQLASQHISAGLARGQNLLSRLEDNERVLINAYQTLADAIRRERTVSPAAEWLVDNFHIVEEQLREIREDLPESYYRELPKLSEGELAGYPRIYAVALALIRHTDCRLELEVLKRFIRAYQEETALSIGELWAVAITLRLALVENLRRLAERTIAARQTRDEANAVADYLLTDPGLQSHELISLLTRTIRKAPDPAFVAQFTKRLHDQDPSLSVALDWLDRQLALTGQSTEQVIQIEHQRQAATQVTVANIITSMRLLSTLDWREFFESVSLIDPLLSSDPVGAYGYMDFGTRDRYRHVIERLGRRSGVAELDVARKVLELAQQAPQTDHEDDAKRHVGYYLIGDGLAQLEVVLAYRPRIGERALRFVLRHPTISYLGAIGAMTVILVTSLAYYAIVSGASVPGLTAVAILSLVPVSDLATSLVNWIVTLIIKPHPLPKMNTTSGISENERTLVVIPTMLSDEAFVRELLEALEVRHLSNQDEHIFFALLTDFIDAPTAHSANDQMLLELARGGIAELNARYPGDSQLTRFHLFHRRRQWNESESKWIGWERKRGKLSEFNRLLRGANDTSFVVTTADSESLAQIRYVITLDSDTDLPHNTARRLIGTISHPLNRPYFDADLGRVTRGYGILQPRISISLVSASSSYFARTFSGNIGVDPYTTAVSDVYQDLFGEGSYTGKGLYDVDAFQRALAGRVPENSLLSHDLFEGLFARTALVTDIELFDDYPARYDTYAKRQHRWTRGDWQVASWILPRAKDRKGQKVRTALPLISRWKILDNLRRSLVAPTVLLWFLTALTLASGSSLVWTLLVLLTLAFPVYANFARALWMPLHGTSWKTHLSNVWGDLLVNTSQLLLNITFIAHQAYLMTDAIVRTLYRKLISGRHLLEWVTAARAGRSTGDWSSLLRFMWPASAIAIVVTGLLVLVNTHSIFAASPFLLLWLLSPYIAYVTGKRITTGPKPLSANEVGNARLLARRTWRFFETFVGEEDHWLPPDNYQEDPVPVIAHRTSPTNVGLLLLSTVAAHDFGYTGLLELVERLELTFTTLEKLPRFRGHFFNWYNTHTLEPLMPQYVSTVDSGNLAGHLIVIKQACNDLERPIFDTQTTAGLADVIKLMSDEMAILGKSRQSTLAVSVKQLQNEIDACTQLVKRPPETLTDWSEFLAKLSKHAATIQDIVNALVHEHGPHGFEDARFWIGALVHQTQALTRDLQTLLPWSSILLRINAVQTDSYNQEIALGFETVKHALNHVPAPSRITELCDQVLVQLSALRPQLEQSFTSRSNPEKVLADLLLLTKSLEQAAQPCRTLMARTSSLARLCERFMDEMEFGFLFDERLKVLTIGYNVSAGRRDESFYDLLASEARLASFVAIASGDVPQEHWFRLGRQLAAVNGKRGLISWSATMFEYLMPLLVMRNYGETLLGETYHTVIAEQIKYGKEHGVPWGVSESAYNARDLHLTYQYGPFGVPGMGLKRGLSENVVVAPYATLLATMLEPRPGARNLDYLKREGALGRFGFYEAIDYTPERLPPDQNSAVIRAFMTHHQGMNLVALDNVLHGNVMQDRFHSDTLVQAHELLLQERIPRGVPATHPRAEEVLSSTLSHKLLRATYARHYGAVDLATPRTQLLSNGTYCVMVTHAGAGFSMCGPVAVTRWREDTTRDSWGSFCYLRDVQSGAVWSAGYQPTVRTPQFYDVSFAEHKVEISRDDVGLRTRTEVVVSPEDNAEVRRVSITNQSSRPREIEVTSYAEVVLASAASDAAHPAFSNLFVETEFIPEDNALLARRRPRSEEDDPVWGVHTVSTEGEVIGTLQYETDRSRFLGRGHSTADPIAIVEDRPLSNSIGAVLDPIFSLRQRVQLQPGSTARLCFATAVARSREEAKRLADKYHDRGAFERETQLAWTKSQVQLRHLDVDLEEAHFFQQLASHVLYSQPILRPRPHVLALNSKTQGGLWRYGISGDLPIIVVRISDARDLRIVRQILRGHEYLRLKGLAIDLVILNDHPASYAQSLQDELIELVRKSGAQNLLDRRGGVFLRRTDIMPEEDRILLHTVARVCIVTERGSLEDQLARPVVESKLPEPFIPSQPPRHDAAPTAPLPELKFFNGLGGFSEDGREYITILGEGQWTPAPWLNIIANARDFGFQISENGGGYTWSVNSRENRLTPWSNDAVSDPPGEVIYVRDEDTGVTWTPTPLPIREVSSYVIKHGQGYTIFEHTSHGIGQELLLFVPTDAPVKISRLRLHNQTNRQRRLSVTSYDDLVLGINSSSSSPFIITELDQTTGAILVRNPYNNDFANRVAFVDMSESKRTVTCDRKEFLGRNGSTARPAALRRHRLSGTMGAGLDPCVAIQTSFELEPYETREIIILLGQTETVEEARLVVSHYRGASAVKRAFEETIRHWDGVLNTIQIRTPDPSFDIVMNRWLLYQTLSCRLWARTAFYQSSGAYGFRDQLQDVLALLYTEPAIARTHIVRAAGRQFSPGDVQHWWHPTTGRGVRTRFSDDLLWLPYVTACYIKVTGDRSVLDQTIAFVEAPTLEPEQAESYTQPVTSAESATLFEHCARALDRSLAVGAHGLPLMGTGDWNDGMNRVGYKGKGESVWVGWFLYKTLEQFTEFCDIRDESNRAQRYREHMVELKSALEQEAWDGDWYARAFFDDGTPLGSARNEECIIDSIAQSWGVISGAADPERARHAMVAVEQHLVRREEGLILLLSPPFDKSALDPGYIKGYVPGVRENGGQYTHAALWTIIAYAMLGDGDRAGELFALLNPINHANTRAGLHRYKVEPYVAAADVYAVAPHGGRGGWTWYTGAAAWMYRAGLEFILGFKLNGNLLTVEPCILRAWPEYEITYRKGTTQYHIRVENPDGISRRIISGKLDGVPLPGNQIPLIDDGGLHEIHLILGEEPVAVPDEVVSTANERPQT